MPNIKSAKKRVKVTKNKHLNNQMYKNSLRTAIKNYEGILAGGTQEDKEQGVRKVVSFIDSAVTRGIMHKNTAARRKSLLMRKLNASRAQQ